MAYIGKSVIGVEHPSTSALTATSVTSTGAVSGTTGSFSSAVSGTTGSFSSTLGVTGKITSTAGITFGSDTAAANVLDDYEEGTFTVQLFDAVTGGNVSSTTGSGFYTKIGRLVVATSNALNDISKSGLTGTNVMYISLPFTASSTAGRSAGSVALHGVDYVDSTTQANITSNVNNSRANLRASGNGRPDVNIKVQDFNGSTDDIVMFTLSYVTDA